MRVEADEHARIILYGVYKREILIYFLSRRARASFKKCNYVHSLKIKSYGDKIRSEDEIFTSPVERHSREAILIFHCASAISKYHTKGSGNRKNIWFFSFPNCESSTDKIMAG